MKLLERAVAPQPFASDAHAKPSQQPAALLPPLVERGAVIVLLLVATFLRTARLNWVQYRYDDDALYTIVMRMVRTGRLPDMGLTSTIALPNGPFQALLLAPFGWVAARPPLMTAGVAFLNILAVVIVYAFTRDFFGRRAGLIALLLASVSPWQVILSRRLLGNDMVAPFAALSLWMLGRWLFRRDSRAALVAGGAVAIAGQVYVIGLECIAPALVALLLAGRRLRSWSLLLGLLLFAALMGPYIWTQAVPQLHSLLFIHGKPQDPSHLSVSSIAFALELASNEGYQAFATVAGGHLDATSGLPGFFGLLGRAAYLLGLGIGLWTILRGPGHLTAERRGIHVLLLTAFVVPTVVLFRPTVPVRLLYLVATFPLPFLYSAFALDRLWVWGGRLAPRLGRAVHGATVAFITGTVGLDLLLGGIFLSVIGQYWSNSDYGIPWGLNDQSARLSRQLAQQHGASRILVLDDASDFNMLEWVLAERQSQVADFDDTRMLVLPGQPTLYVAPGNQPAERTLATDYQQYLLRQVRWPGDGAIVRYYLLPPSTAAAPLPPGAIALAWVAGGLVRLDGVVAPQRLQPGKDIAIQLYMTILRRPPAGTPDFSVFTHLVDASGNALAKQDQPAFRTKDWLPGDRVIQTFTLTVPAGVSPGLMSLAIGLYSTDTHGTTIRPLSLVDAHGSALGAAASLPLGAIAPAAPPPATHPLAVQFTGGIGLAGYDVSRNGNVLTVTPHWTASAPIKRDYTAFVHLLDAKGRLIAQNDSPPLGGRFPTIYWQVGDRIADSHAIRLPAGLVPGTYTLAFGLYDSKTKAPLPVLGGKPVVANVLAP